jgi:simple sugar transport system ATP-binding protein
MTDREPALVEARGIGKRFGSVVALQGADFVLRAGRVGAIVGENGAGKSTLAKILAGVYRADEGEIRVEGKPVVLASRRRAASLGIGFVPQSLSFVGTLDVVDNHLLADSGFMLDRVASRRALGLAAARLGVDVVLDRPVETLGMAERQLAEIVSCVVHGARVLLLDEPTSALGPIEVDRLIAALKLLSAEGTSVGLVTHRVREVLEAAHDVTVLRRGAVVFSGSAAGLDAPAVSRLMVGAGEIGRPIRPTPGPVPRLEVDRLSVGSGGRRFLEEVSFAVRRGEVLGVAGVVGPAQPALAEALAGLRADARGRIAVDGVDIIGRPTEAQRCGVAFVPEDRTLGLLPDQAVSVNASLLRIGGAGFGRFGLRKRSAETRLARAVVERFDVRPRSVGLAAGLLSGGNQQKLLVGRELEREPSVIVAHGPTRGLDLAAAAAIRADLVSAAREGAAVVVISADLDELLSISTRILVLAGRSIAAEFDCRDADGDLEGFVHRIGLAMIGAGEEAA